MRDSFPATSRLCLSWILRSLGLPAGKGCAVNGPDGTSPSTIFPIFRKRSYQGGSGFILNWFFQALAYNKAVFSEARVDRYVQAYSKPSSLHAGFEYYRAFEKDALDNQDHESAKLAMPVLSIGGANSRLNKYVVDQLRAGTTQLTGDLAPQSGHWIPEEQPEWLARRLMEFIAAH